MIKKDNISHFFKTHHELGVIFHKLAREIKSIDSEALLNNLAVEDIDFILDYQMGKHYDDHWLLLLKNSNGHYFFMATELRVDFILESGDEHYYLSNDVSYHSKNLQTLVNHLKEYHRKNLNLNFINSYIEKEKLEKEVLNKTTQKTPSIKI